MNQNAFLEMLKVLLIIGLNVVVVAFTIKLLDVLTPMGEKEDRIGKRDVAAEHLLKPKIFLNQIQNSPRIKLKKSVASDISPYDETKVYNYNKNSLLSLKIIKKNLINLLNKNIYFINTLYMGSLRSNSIKSYYGANRPKFSIRKDEKLDKIYMEFFYENGTKMYSYRYVNKNTILFSFYNSMGFNDKNLYLNLYDLKFVNNTNNLYYFIPIDIIVLHVFLDTENVSELMESKNKIVDKG